VHVADRQWYEAAAGDGVGLCDGGRGRAKTSVATRTSALTLRTRLLLCG
jgi:hypothetical protein